MTSKEFETGWKHFCSCIDFGNSALDAEAIGFMNEAPAEIIKALDFANTDENPYILHGEELKRTENAVKTRKRK